MKLSVIIPVYKTEHTLDRCIESVLRQDIDGELEIILVDDGSPDNSPQLCDAWNEKLASPNSMETSDKGITINVIHKPNGGLSDARNKGMEIATGDLITFVDSDDELSPDTFTPLVRFMQDNPDIDILEYPILIHAGNTSEHRLDFEDRIWQSAKEYWEQTEAWEHCYACNKIFRRGIIEGMQFPVGRIFEDIWFYPEVLSKNPKVATASKGLYRYLWNDSSITVTAGSAAWENLLCGYQRMLSLMKMEENSYSVGKVRYKMLNAQLFLYAMNKKIVVREFKLHLKHAGSAIDVLKALSNNNIGLKALCKMYALFKNTIYK